MTTRKKSSTFWGKKCTHRQNLGYAYVSIYPFSSNFLLVNELRSTRIILLFAVFLAGQTTVVACITALCNSVACVMRRATLFREAVNTRDVLFDSWLPGSAAASYDARRAARADGGRSTRTWSASVRQTTAGQYVNVDDDDDDIVHLSVAI